MPDTCLEELTRADVKRIAASIYEPQPRVWENGRWGCPQCQSSNEASASTCACGISRDGLAEFCEGRSEVLKRFESDQPHVIEGALLWSIPALLVWAGFTAAIVEIWSKLHG